MPNYSLLCRKLLLQAEQIKKRQSLGKFVIRQDELKKNCLLKILAFDNAGDKWV